MLKFKLSPHPSLFHESFILFIFSLPIILTVSIQTIISLSNLYLLSRLNITSLAIGGFAMTFFLFAFVAGYGLMSASLAHMSQAYKNNDTCRISEILSNMLVILFVFTIVAVIALISIVWVLGFSIYTTKFRAELLPLEAILLAGLYPSLVFGLFRALTFCVSRPISVMIYSVPFILINYFLADAFIFGRFGFPSLGMLGMAVGTTINTILMAFFFILYLSTSKTYRIYFKALCLPTKAVSSSLLVESWPMALAYVLLFGILLLVSTLVAHYSIKELAANQVAMQLVDLIFIFGLALAHASMIRTGYALAERSQIQ